MAVASSVLEFQEAFAYFDSDRDGRINSAELTEVLRALGHVMTHNELAFVIKQTEKVYGGFLSFPNFVKIYTAFVEGKVGHASVYAGTIEDAVKEFVTLCRQRTDGQILIRDVQTLMSRVGDKMDEHSLLQLLKQLQPPPQGKRLGDGTLSVTGLGSHVVLLPSPRTGLHVPTAAQAVGSARSLSPAANGGFRRPGSASSSFSPLRSTTDAPGSEPYVDVKILVSKVMASIPA